MSREEDVSGEPDPRVAEWQERFARKGGKGDAYEGDTVVDVPGHTLNGAAPHKDKQAGPIEVPIPEPPAWPSPPDKAALSGLAGEVVTTIDPQTEADPVAILVQFLAAFGNLVGRSAFRAVGPCRHYPNLFTCIVGPTAKGRKGTSWRWVGSLLEPVDEHWAENCVLNGLSSGEGLVHALRDDAEKDKRLLIVEEEFASVLRVAGRDGNTLSPVLRQGWDGGRLNVLTRNNPLHATDVHLSIIGHVTREDLLSQLSKTDAANGFANRFLWVAARRSKFLPDGGEVPGLKVLEPYLRDAADHAAQTKIMSRSLPARDLWHAEYKRLASDRPGTLGFVTSRAEAQTLRLSVLYALLDCKAEIDVSHLSAAIALWDYCERSCGWVFGAGVGNKDADEILEVMRGSENGLSRSEISGLFHRNRSAMQIASAIGALRDAGLIFSKNVPTGGRPSERWYAQSTK